MEALSTAGFSLATDVAEWLVKRGMPFRQAHEVSGACVALAESRGCGLEDLSDQDFAGVDPLLVGQVDSGEGAVRGEDGAGGAGGEGTVREVLSARGSVLARNGVGGTAPARVAQQLAAAEAELARLLG